MFKRLNTTEPVKTFVFEQLNKKNMLMFYGNLNVKDLKKELKDYFKPKMDKWLFKRANWMIVAMAIKEKVNEIENNKD